MARTTGQRVEELSKAMGGRFKLTALVQKRVRDYHVTGRAFMPKVKNLDELFELVLDQVEAGEIRLRLPEEKPPTFKELTGGEAEEAEAAEGLQQLQAEAEEEEEEETAAEGEAKEESETLEEPAEAEEEIEAEVAEEAEAEEEAGAEAAEEAEAETAKVGAATENGAETDVQEEETEE